MADFICYPDGSVEDVRPQVLFTSPRKERPPQADPAPATWGRNQHVDPPTATWGKNLLACGILLLLFGALWAIVEGVPALYNWAFPDYRAEASRALNRGDIDGAIAIYTTAISRWPSDPSRYIDRAFAHEWQKRYEAAIEDLNEALRLDPTNHKALFSRGRCYMALHQYDKAIE